MKLTEWIKKLFKRKNSNSNEESKKDTSQESTKSPPLVQTKAKHNDENPSKSPESSSSISNSKVELNSLTPSHYGEYNEILKKVFRGKEHKNDHNIAITADYGEGKSSVINSFLNLKENKEIKQETITVSLSKYNYKNNDSTKQPCEKSHEHNGDYSICEHLHSVENRIEVQIINQILYQIDSKDIYLSKYKIKENLPDGWRWFLGVLAAILIFSIYNLIFCLSGNIKEWSNWTDKLGLWLGWLVVIIPLSIFAFFFVFYQQWQRISNIVFNVFGSKIETNYFKNNAFNLSIWDQEWREIIYIISSSKKNYIIFEDLDRLENYEILSKLKDLCLTLNNQKNKQKNNENEQNNKNIKFIYAISDSVFKNEKDKTKFFDLIIPILPVSNYWSRIGIWKSSLDPNHIPGEKLIEKMSNYIFDIRLIKHIANEYNIALSLNEKFLFLIEKENIQEFFNVLFCLIIIKNIFIDEFSKFKNNFNLDKLNINKNHEQIILFTELKEILNGNKDNNYFGEIISKNIFSSLTEIEINYLNFINENNNLNINDFFNAELPHVNYLIFLINKKINNNFNWKKLLNLSIIEYLILNWEQNQNNEILKKTIMLLFNAFDNEEVESKSIKTLWKDLFIKLIFKSEEVKHEFYKFLSSNFDFNVLENLNKWLISNEIQEKYNEWLLEINIHFKKHIENIKNIKNIKK